ncbi:hypothetical protein DRP77_00190 [Candidatus Poribacteria bacterium]|nr:MAG: hypothetical protein DRP77_00190 [Candidatus Poribacteria bacterium]
MSPRERIKRIFSRRPADRVGFWLGQPHRDTVPILLEWFGQPDLEGVRRLLGDDIRWIPAGVYRHPEGKPPFQGRVFAECEDVREVEAFEWPDPDYLDFNPTLEALKRAEGFYRLSGMWSPFFHLVADLFGMENYFIKMHTNPKVVHAVTRHVVDYFLEGNRRFFEMAGDLMDGFFFGNDFGTQIDLFMSPEHFEEFVLPYLRELVELAKSYGYQVVLHSCGSIYKAIPYLIDAGVDALHPLQAKAVNMDAETLAREFKGKIAFMGGVDTQELLVRGTPEEVKEEVRRIKELLGPALVVSPSHEAILPNVPPENIEAMAEAALEG